MNFQKFNSQYEKKTSKQFMFVSTNFSKIKRNNLCIIKKKIVALYEINVYWEKSGVVTNNYVDLRYR